MSQIKLISLEYFSIRKKCEIGKCEVIAMCSRPESLTLQLSFNAMTTDIPCGSGQMILKVFAVT